MTEEEKKAIDLLKFYEGFFKNIGHEEEVKSIESVINLIEKLQKEIEEKTTIIMAGAEKVKQLEKEFITKQEIKENYIPKDKIKGKIKEYNKEIKTYEDKMLEITQREKHQAIEDKDYIKYSCIISNFTDKIKLLKNLIEEE